MASVKPAKPANPEQEDGMNTNPFEFLGRGKAVLDATRRVELRLAELFSKYLSLKEKFGVDSARDMIRDEMYAFLGTLDPELGPDDTEPRRAVADEIWGWEADV
jgi:hypothetical protein